MFDRAKPLAWLCAGAIVAIPALAAGCGGDNNNEDTSAATTPATPSGTAAGGTGGTIDVNETEFALTPSDPTVAAGTVTINASNGGQTDHAIEVEGPNGDQKSDTIAPGDKTTLTVDLSKPGTYEWYCPIDGHKDQGMKGEITVEG